MWQSGCRQTLVIENPGPQSERPHVYHEDKFILSERGGREALKSKRGEYVLAEQNVPQSRQLQKPESEQKTYYRKTPLISTYVFSGLATE